MKILYIATIKVNSMHLVTHVISYCPSINHVKPAELTKCANESVKCLASYRRVADLDRLYAQLFNSICVLYNIYIAGGSLTIAI